MENFPYPITVRQFECRGTKYNVALTPELYPEEDGLDFTGGWLVLLISQKQGTTTFTLEPHELVRWQASEEVDFDIMVELDKIIQELRPDTVKANNSSNLAEDGKDENRL